MTSVLNDDDGRLPIRLADCNWQTRWLVIALGVLAILRLSPLFSGLWVSLLPWWLAMLLAGILPQLFFLIYPLRTRRPRRPLWIPSPTKLFAEFGIAVGIVISLVAVMILAGYVVDRISPGKSLTPEAVQQLARIQHPWLIGLMVVLATLVAPISEEVFFRGFLQNALSARIPTALATLLQVAIFGGSHFFGAAHGIAAAVMGLVLTAIYRWRQTLVTPIFVHAGTNVFGSAVILAMAIAYANSPMLGVGGASADKQCVVREIVPNSAAEKAGLQVGDVIVRFDGRSIDDARQLAELVRMRAVGDTVTVTIKRGSQELDLHAMLQRRSRP